MPKLPRWQTILLRKSVKGVNMKNTRRNFLKVASATAGVSAVTGMVGCASVGGVAKPKVVVVGGGYGGATVAK